MIAAAFWFTAGAVTGALVSIFAPKAWNKFRGNVAGVVKDLRDND